MRKPLLTLFFIAFGIFAFAQGTSIELGGDSYNYMERLDIKYAKVIPIEFTVEKPYYRADVARVAESLLLSNIRFSKVQKAQLQYLVDENPEWLDSLHSHTPRPLFKVLYTEPASFYSVSSKKKGLWDLKFNPMLGATIGGESAGGGRFQFNRSIGLEVRGDIKQVFSFYFNATGNDERPPLYVANQYQTGAYRNVPGEAYFKTYSSSIFKFKDGIDYFDARGYINVNVLKYINISFGRDKFFIGDGDRSLILSDYSAPYLFLRFNVHFWRFTYDNIYAELTSEYTRGADQLLPKKYLAFHHLSLQPAHWLKLGIFESVILSRSNTFEFQYLNPVIFYRAIEHELGSPDNVLVGGDFKANIASHASLYGQLVLDEFNFKDFFARNGSWANKWGIQVGVKYIDIVPNLDGKIEFNYVRPYTYTHDVGVDNYTNYNQALADPLGANFYEFILNLHYHPLPKLAFNLKYMVAKTGGDTLINGTLSNYGGDIFTASGNGSLITNQLGNKVAQGAKGTLNYFEFLATYQVWHNINLDASILYRDFETLKSPNNPTASLSTFMFNIGFRINLARRTYQF